MYRKELGILSSSFFFRFSHDDLAAHPDRFTERVMGYDRQGNILGLKRHGQTSPTGYGLIDDLTLTYKGNQLQRVQDGIPAVAVSGNMEFKDGADAEAEYRYDANGNLTKDLNKKLAGIEYNSLNLPCKVRFDNGDSITYLYDAGGTKLRTTHVTGGVTVTRDYLGNALYENGSLVKLLTEQGCVTLPDGRHHYRHTDHQGNIRAVTDRSGQVEEVNHYYPFGGLFSSALNVQPYKYNGKELDRVGGLDWYDYGARMYDASLGRWHAVNPLAEKYAEVSPYVYCGNRPVNGMDPDGRDWYRHNDTGSYYWQEGHRNRDGYTRLGASVSIELGKDTYFNAYQNGGILANRAVNAFDLIRSSSALRNRFLGKYSPLSEQSKSELFNALNNRDLNDLGRPIGEALVEFSIAQFGGFVLSKALGWGLGRLAAEGAAKTGAQYTKSSLKLGQEMHESYKVGADGIKEFRLPSGKRIDFLDVNNGIIHELKPFNPRAMKAGQKQLEMYLKEIQSPATLLKHPEFRGIDWKTVLDTY